MLAGSNPPEVCGIGDYTAQLVAALRGIGVEVEVPVERKWRERDLIKVLRCCDTGERGLLHIQYPGVGFGASLAPQALSLLRPCVATLHEFSRVHWLRRAAMLPMCVRSHVIFTSEHEMYCATRWAPGLLPRSQVIPIGSNIPVFKGKRERDMSEIIYFGLIARKKGLEDFLELVRLIRQRQLPYHARIIGQVVSGVRDLEEYAANIIRSSTGLPVEWVLNRPPTEVAELLAVAGFGYLPFPDGASDRRGSLKALLAARVPCMTTEGDQTTASLRDAITICNSPEVALDRVIQLSHSPEEVSMCLNRASRFVESCSWPNIASRHVELYESLCGGLHAQGENR